MRQSEGCHAVVIEIAYTSNGPVDRSRGERLLQDLSALLLTTVETAVANAPCAPPDHEMRTAEFTPD